MKAYLVGGSVRDRLLGRVPKDQDYVVLDGTEEELLEKGYVHVGQSFSIFIDPVTRAEYAFVRGKDLQEDLERRDLTINAMAMDDEGNLIDPFHGLVDLQNKVLRHVSSHFGDDPLRVIRVARFKAQLAGFEIHPETKTLMKQIASSSSYQKLLFERVFTELRMALNTGKPSVFFEVLKEVDGLNPFFQELHSLIGVPQNPLYHPEGDCWIHTMLVLDNSAKLSQDIRIRYSALVHDLGKGITPKEILPKHIGHEESGVKLVRNMGRRLYIPHEWTEAAVIVTKFHLRVHRLKEMKASSVVRMLYEMDAFRKQDLVQILARTCEADEMGKFKEAVPEGKMLEDIFQAIKDVDMNEIDPALEGKAISEAIRAWRVRRLKVFFSEGDGSHE